MSATTDSTGITHLIINSPFEEPSSHWSYNRETRTFSREAGRRPAGYVTATPGAKSFDDPGIFRELPLVNQIRPRVKAWAGGIPGHFRHNAKSCWNTGKIRSSGTVAASFSASLKPLKR